MRMDVIDERVAYDSLCKSREGRRSLKYQLEYCNSDPNELVIHVDQRLVYNHPVCFEEAEDSENYIKALEGEVLNPKALITFHKAITELDGVEAEIWFQRYRIGVRKAELFYWEDIVPCILDVLRTFVARDQGSLEEAAPPKTVDEDWNDVSCEEQDREA